MPNSGTEYDDMIKKIISEEPASAALDVGIGAGKIGQFIRAIHPKCLVYGIEAHGAYAEQFAVAWQIYHKRYIGDALLVSLEIPRARFDLVVMGDVIEHFWLHELQSLVDYWVQRSSRILLVWPTGFRQDDAGGVASEIHRSEPTLADLTRFDVRRYHKVSRKIGGHKHLAVIQGKWKRQ
jgi:hypothetical protein